MKHLKAREGRMPVIPKEWGVRKGDEEEGKRRERENEETFVTGLPWPQSLVHTHNKQGEGGGKGAVTAATRRMHNSKVIVMTVRTANRVATGLVSHTPCWLCTVQAQWYRTCPLGQRSTGSQCFCMPLASLLSVGLGAHHLSVKLHQLSSHMVSSVESCASVGHTNIYSTV